MKQNSTTKSVSFLLACTVIAMDLAKRVFQVAAEDTCGKVLYEHRIKSREAFAAFLRQLPAELTILMETGPRAQAWARQLLEPGRLMEGTPPV